MSNRSPALIKIVSEGGGAWGLSDEAYLRWWRSLPEDDKQTFVTLGGDDVLGRFCCTYDYLTVSEGEAPLTLIRAWSIATGKSEDEHETKIRAQRAWENTAVRELLARLQSRETERAERRIERAATYLVEDTIQKAIKSESLEQRSKAINAAVRFLESIKDDRKDWRELRIKLENEALKKAITAKSTDDDDKPLTTEDAEGYVKALVGVLGVERMKALLPAHDA